MDLNRFKPALVVILPILLAACGGSSGSSDKVSGDLSTAARTTVLAANDSDCPNGGILVETGIDENANGVLDSSEVDSSQKVCNGLNGSAGSNGVNGSNGSDGLGSLVALTDEPAGGNCEFGGTRVDSGVDDNANNILDSGEIDSSQFVCNGQPGVNGANGADGSDGLVSLLAMNDEPAGINCEFGGTRIESGIDNNGNGALDATEVTDTQFICALSSSRFDGLVYRTDSRVSGMHELFRTSKDANTATKLAGPKPITGAVGSFSVSPDHTQVAYIAPLESNTYELFVSSLVDGSPPLRVSGALVSGGYVSNFKWSPDGSRLAYVAAQDDLSELALYSVFSDGAGNVKISGSTAASSSIVVEDYQWAPDSSRVVYRADQDTDGVIELFSVLPDGSGNVKVSGPLVALGSVQSFQWAPNSAQIAYLADQETRLLGELYVTSPDASTPLKVSIPLASGSYGLTGFQWSPDSIHIAFRADPNTVYSDLYSVTADGNATVNLSAPLNTGDGARNYQWSPDGSRIVFALNDGLHVASADGATSTKISGVLASDQMITGLPQWAPDGSRLAYVANQGALTIDELYSVLPDGSGNTKISGTLVDGGDVGFFSWSPDSSQLAYVADQDTDNRFELFIVKPDGTANVKISGALTAGGNVGGFGWSPDGSRLAYVADQDTVEQFELFTVLPDGTGNVKVSGAIDTNVSGYGFDFSW